ncbi:MAG TPA: DUF5615 family PIN-like protein [Euzebya sp.]|nr:DUF5615 family PIN-like protein [Euzebya sp.]
MRFLLDEMFPSACCQQLRDRGHDAVSVRDCGLGGRPDPVVADVARSERRVLVTENVKDFAGERDLVMVMVLKAGLPSEGMAHHLAQRLISWAQANPEPYVGMHWG